MTARLRDVTRLALVSQPSCRGSSTAWSPRTRHQVRRPRGRPRRPRHGDGEGRAGVPRHRPRARRDRRGERMTVLSDDELCNSATSPPSSAASTPRASRSATSPAPAPGDGSGLRGSDRRRRLRSRLRQDLLCVRMDTLVLGAKGRTPTSGSLSEREQETNAPSPRGTTPCAAAASQRREDDRALARTPRPRGAVGRRPIGVAGRHGVHRIDRIAQRRPVADGLPAHRASGRAA